MATAASYEGPPHNGNVTFVAADTTVAKSLGVTPATLGTKVKEIFGWGGATTPGTPVFRILHNDKVIFTKTLPGGADATQFRVPFDNFILASGETLKGQMGATIAGGGSLDVTVWAADY